MDTVAELAPLVDDLGGGLLRADTKGEAEGIIDRWGERLAESPELVGQLFRANSQTNLAGQLFVRDVEVGLSRRTLADERAPAFLRLAFREAIEHFASRAIMSAEAFADLLDAERFRAFSMAKAVSLAVVERAKGLLDDAMQPEGLGLRGFIKAIGEGDLALGITQSHPGYLENVYRTATATSYNAGRLRGQMDPDVVAATGYWQYVTAGDDRVRTAHAALDGKQWRIGDPEALAVYPPNSYQCRCVCVVVGRDDASDAQMGMAVDVGDAVTEGFRGPPDATIEAEAAAA